jgi:hypothetical protein
MREFSAFAAIPAFADCSKKLLILENTRKISLCKGGMTVAYQESEEVQPFT